MKKSVCLALALALLLVGCTPAETPSSETSSEYSDYCEQIYNSITEEMSDAAEKNPKTFTAEQLEYYESILDPFDVSFGVCSVPGIDFKNPSQIPADSLLNFYCQNGFEAYLNAHPTTDEVLRVPAEEVERFVQNYFDVSSEHLRTAKTYKYDSTDGTYGFRTEMGFGGFHGYLISNVIEDGDLLIFYCSGGASETKGCNAIAVQLTDDGFKYVCAKGFMEYDVSAPVSSTVGDTSSEHSTESIPDEVWQKIIDSQFSYKSPAPEGFLSWKEAVEYLNENNANCFAGIDIDKLDFSRILPIDNPLSEDYWGFTSITEKTEFYNHLLECKTLLSPELKAAHGDPDIDLCIFNADFSEGIVISIWKSRKIFASNDMMGKFYSHGKKQGIYTQTNTWYELTLNENRKESLLQSALDLSKTTATQVNITGLGYGYVFSDGEHEYFMRTNDYVHKYIKYVPVMVTEYEKLYSFDEICDIIKDYDNFVDSGYIKVYTYDDFYVSK